MAFLKPGEVIHGKALARGGHLSHGAKVNFSGKDYQVYTYAYANGYSYYRRGELEA